MKKLLWTTLFCSLLAQMATGCIIVEDDPEPEPTPIPTPPPPPPPPGPGVLDVTWTLTEGLAPDDIDTDCGEGITAEIVAEDLDTGEQYIDLYDCVDGAGVTSERPPGEYDVWVNIYNGLDVLASDLIAQSDYQTVTVAGDDTVLLDFRFPTGGFFYLTWDIEDEFGALNCEDVPADGVSILSTLVGPDTAIDDIYNCTDYEATTPQMLLGEYVVSVSLLDGDTNLNEVSVAEQFFLEYGNQVVDLQNFVFDVQ